MASWFPDAWVSTEREGPEGSVYTLTRRGAPAHRVAFRPKADATAPATALASMLAKALRERCMAELNDWFGRRVAGLKPTAGYPGDAPRFLAALDAAGALADVDRPTLVRWR